MISHKMFAHLIHTNIRNFRHCGGVFGAFFLVGGGGEGQLHVLLWILRLDTTGDN